MSSTTRREMERRGSVVAPEHHAFDALQQPLPPCAAAFVTLGPLALAHQAVVPRDPVPAPILDDRLLANQNVQRAPSVS